MTAAIEISGRMLKKEEGFRAKPYLCSEGFPTIGYGEKIGEKYEPLPNITTTEPEAYKKMLATITANEKTILNNPDLYRCYFHLNDARKAVMLSIAYQIGIYGVLKFKKMLGALERADYSAAADEMLNSLAARQTPARWKRNAEQMRSGELNAYYQS
jgi:lysozyme